jgi:hypothetical protein
LEPSPPGGVSGCIRNNSGSQALFTNYL